jgi:TRAP-type C4-dicarboxylate transport system permease small subunit
MTNLLNWIFRLSRWANSVAGFALVWIMGITVMDVFLRSMGKPIPGVFELAAFSGALVIGFALPLTSWRRGHIYVDFLVQKLPMRVRQVFHGVTRTMGFSLFFLIAWNLLAMGNDLRRSGEVSLTLQLPFYPIVYAVGISCLILCLVLIGDILKIIRGDYE